MTKSESNKQRYEYLKSRNRCVDCGKQDAFTLIGKVRCSDCKDKSDIAVKKYREQNKEKIAKEKHSIREERKSKHFCVACGKFPARPNRTECVRCARKRVTRQTKYNQETNRKDCVNYPRGDNGYCWQCNKVLAMPKHKLCKECYEKNSQYREKANEQRRRNRLKEEILQTNL